MIFTELRFMLFFTVVFAVHWLLRGRARKVWLLLASQAFYAAWDWRFLSLIWLSIAVDYAIARSMEGRDLAARRPLMALSLVVNLGILGFFKYWDFFADSAVAFTAWIGLPLSLPVLQLILPLGISFYTFQTLSYSIDVGRGRLEASRSLLDVALFVSFFPQLVAGPIVRARQFLPQLARERRLREVQFRSSLGLFLVGFVKKACVADQAAKVVDAVFAAPEAYGVLAKWLASLLYSLQIYCDFSGYSDMAIATAGLLGYRLALNFDAPYLATSMRDFWRRWHISLSSWFRDYLYVPLGGNRLGSGRTAVNLWIVFLLCGLWHGANWTFVVWGLWHGLFLSLERQVPVHHLPVWLRRLYVLLAVNLGFVIFRAPDLAGGLRFVRGMFWPLGGAGPVPALPPSPLWWGLLGAFALMHVLVYRRVFRRGLDELPDWAFAAGYGAALALVLPWVVMGYRPFIYFQF
jgi:alginate O-acetyltransferase complex protein AlgI